MEKENYFSETDFAFAKGLQSGKDHAEHEIKTLKEDNDKMIWIIRRLMWFNPKLVTKLANDIEYPEILELIK